MDEPSICPSNGWRLGGFYAVVAYLPSPLSDFVNSLRKELVPGCRLRSHVTVLPPRKLTAPTDRLVAGFAEQLSGAQPFEVQLSGVELFESTRVAYLSIGEGRNELLQLHRQLNRAAFAFNEPFPFHPHVTIAQEIGPGEVGAVLEAARRQWREFSHPRRFCVETLSFVRNVDPDTWEDLSECSLRTVSPLQTA
ncbi:MAG: 2'-5' RNA ligase family protein [Acidobacteria bacterium]|nr:2'-5' RNA ligase family protein [Acidobacteriota bacterium]